jgi:hypothetical protein
MGPRLASHRSTASLDDVGSLLATGTTAQAIAEEMLSGVGTRLAHTRRVAAQAHEVRVLLEEPWKSAIVDAAWLHDIGYAQSIVQVGFHPLDGARWLARQGWPVEVCRLVAWHTCAGTEACIRELGDQLAGEFREPPVLPRAAMTWADLTSSPEGDQWTADRRLDEILDRYPAASIVHRATNHNRAQLVEMVGLIEFLLPAL